ncbi:MAG TPA: FAD-binding oxidoreductase [Acidimicrobiia bacterium]|nr:FAD-binding oxidoreductase [Acidimicrobiia bacterium]
MRAVRPETPRAKTLILDVPAWPGHLPGHHVDVRLTAPDGYQAERSYSIASAPEDDNLALTVERLDDGEVSIYLCDDLRPGDLLELRGPIGGYFTWQAADGGPLVLVGGGSGVVPLVAMLRHLSAVHAQIEATLLVSAGSWDDVLYPDELDAFATEGVQVRCTLTRRTPPGWEGWSRRVDAQMLRDLDADPTRRPRVYVCGPTPFVERVADLFVAAGHDPSLVKTERFGPTGR